MRQFGCRVNSKENCVTPNTRYICKANQFCEDALVSVNEFLKKVLENFFLLFSKKGSDVRLVLNSLLRPVIFQYRVVVLKNRGNLLVDSLKPV